MMYLTGEPWPAPLRNIADMPRPWIAPLDSLYGRSPWLRSIKAKPFRRITDGNAARTVKVPKDNPAKKYARWYDARMWDI